MGNYNPHAPYIIGEEWVPIRQADYQPDALTERGYTFGIDHAATIVSGNFYVASAPVVQSAGHLLNVYPEGTEDLSGPIQQLVIPVSSFAVTGAGAACDPTGSTNCLTTYADGKTLLFLGGNAPEVGVSFDVTSYSQPLFGKRILNIEILYKADGTQEALDRCQFELARLSATGSGYGYALGIRQETPGATLDTADAVPMTDLNPFWQAGLASTFTPNIQKYIYPWRYQELALLAATATTDRLILRVTCSLIGLPNDFLALGYLGLRVTYCEEKRVLYGGYFLNGNSTSNDQYYPDSGPALVALRTTALAIPGSTAAGRYTVTQTTRDLSPATLPQVPNLRALRELYDIPPQRGILVDYAGNRKGEQFSAELTSVLPHITLHTATAVVTGVHAYGTQIAAPVYGTITAIQEIEDEPVGTAKTYPQVRFYARRFGETTVALRLIDVAGGLSTVSITVAEFDALPEIVDGWKEITLRFATPPTFSTAAGDVDWRWDAVGEIASNQWQVLGADGPNSITQTIAPATYYAPIGDTVTLTWQSPLISGTANDTLSDAILIFSQDPPTVTGFAITTGTQAVTGLGLDCGSPQRCIPTGIYYNQVSWSAQTALPVTGFAWYELQRSDTVNPGTWDTIMLATSPTVTGFRDYEARVDELSSYRLRVCNALEFCGPWATGTATLPAPGVTGAGSGNSLLLFTSNEQPESNLAYLMQFQGKPVETFAFPEADMVALQQMFGKDYFTAFHPLERGGEQFQRNILTAAAAVPLPSMGNFHSLRDLAWADLPYVCVRDELGNRWYANIQVPSGEVRRNRTRYIAQIRVSEVTGTPSPVDPS